MFPNGEALPLVGRVGRGVYPRVTRQKDHTNANARAKRLRREPTSAEARLRKLLRKLEGFHFRYQLPLGDFVFDAGEHSLKLLIELDGGIHDLPEVQARDRIKEAWATSQGYAVIRIPNDYVFGTGEPAVAMILAAARRCSRSDL